MSTPPNWGQSPQGPANPNSGSGGSGQFGPAAGGFGQPGQSGYGQPASGGYGQGAPGQQGNYGQHGVAGQQAGAGQQGSYGQQGAPGRQGGFGPPAGYGQGGQTPPPAFGQPAGPAQQTGFGQPAAPGQQAGFGQPARQFGPGQGAGAQQFGQPGGTQGYGQQGFGAQPGAPAKKKMSTGLLVALGAAALVVLLVAGVVIGEFVTRSNVNSDLAEKTGSISLAQGDGEVQIEGDYEVSVAGFSYLASSIGGTYEHISFTGVEQTFNGKPFESSFDAYGVPSDLAGPAERIEFRMFFSAETFEDFAMGNMGEDSTVNGVELRDGEIAFSFGTDPIELDQVVEFRVENG